MMKLRFVVSLLIVFVLAACNSATPPPTTPTELPADTATPSPAPSATSTPFPSLTPTITPSPTATPSYYVRDGTPVPQPAEAISPVNVSQIAELARWGNGAINEISFAPDEKLLLVQTTIGVFAYDPDTIEEVWRFELVQGATRMAISPSGRWLGLGAFDGHIYMLELQQGILLDSWQDRNESVDALAFSPNESMLATGGENGYMHLWQIEDGLKISILEKIAFQNFVSDIYFYNDQHVLVVWAEFVFDTWDIVNRENQAQFAGWRNYGVSPDNGYIATTDGEVYNVLTGNKLLLDDFSSSVRYVLDAEISNSGELVAIAGSGLPRISIWDADSGQKILNLDTTLSGSFNPNKFARPAITSGPGPGSIYELEFSPDDSILAARDGQGEVDLWDVKTGVLLRTLEGSANNMFFSSDGQTLFSYYASEMVTLNVNNGAREVFHIEGRKYGKRLNYASTGDWLAQDTRLWNTADGNVLQLPRGEEFLSFSLDGQQVNSILPQWWLVSRSVDGLALINQVALEEPPADAFGYWSMWLRPSGWELSPDKISLYLGGREDPGLVWNAQDGSYDGRFGLSLLPTFGFSPNGSYFVEIYSRGIFVRHVREPEGLDLDVDGDVYHHSFSFSNDSRFLLIAGEELLRVYDMHSLELAKSLNLSELNAKAGSIAMSPDNDLIALSDGLRIKIYAFPSGDLLSAFQAQFEAVHNLTFSPDGHYLASASSDGTVRLWGIPDTMP